MTKERVGKKNSDEQNHRKGFRIHGKVQVLESSQGVPELGIEALDRDLIRDDRLGSTITDTEGCFELRYEKKDFQGLFFEQKPDLYLRVKTPDGRVIHTTEDKVRYGAGRTEAFIIKIRRSDLEGVLALDIKTIAVSPDLAKADDQIKVTVVGDTGGRARFSIANVFSAADVLMAETSEEPGTYSGFYTADIGDNVENATVTVVLTTRSGETICREAEQRVTIDTIPPRITEAKVTREVVSNGQMLQLRATSEQGCKLIADISKLDTTQSTVSLNEKRDGSGVYQKRIRISNENTASNGIKSIRITATDAAGNESEPEIVTIELRNSELHTIRGLSNNAAARLNRVGVVTLADLRQIDIKKLARRTRLSQKRLEKYRAAAKLQAAGLDANVVHALVHIGEIRSPAQLALTSPENIDQIVQAGVREGIIPRELAAVANYSNLLIVAGVGTTLQHIDAYWADAKFDENTCQTECADEFSAFGCHAYLLELVRISEMSWHKLEQTFKRDFLAVTDAPVSRIDLSIQVLERALSENLGNPPRLQDHWDDYDRALNRSLVRIIVESTGKSETKLTADYPIAFDSNRPWADRNENIDELIYALPSKSDYNEVLVTQLKRRTGKSEEDLAAEHPEAFDSSSSLQNRNKTLEKILNLSSPATKVHEALAAVASRKLEALVKQSGRTLSQLRRRYYISFSPEDCGETTTCRQAVLTLQEYLAQKAYTESKYEYPTYDEWRVEQVKKFYPENIYTHEFKIPLIRGNRQLLRQHLEQARTILDSVRVSVGGNRSQKDDLLNSFRWRNPYYTNLKAGLDLIQECYEVDDLMNKGHQAFFNEEYQQARPYYLEAAEKIRLTSKQLSKPMGEALLPLWTSEDEDSYFKGGPQEAAQAASDFFEKTLSSYTDKRKPGVELARGQVKLKGVNRTNGTFSPMWKEGLSAQGWKQHLEKFEWLGNGFSVNHNFLQGKGLILYKPSNYWRNYALETEISGSTIEVLFRYNTPKQAGSVLLTPWVTDVGGVAGIHIMTHPYIYESSYGTTSINSKSYLRLRVEITGQRVSSQLWLRNEQFDWDVVTKLSMDAPIGHLPKHGVFGFTGDMKCYRIAAWDFDPAKGAVSDLAFFLMPPKGIVDRSHPPSLAGRYIYRQWIPSDENMISEWVEELTKYISMSYNESDWIIEPHVVDKDPFDPFYQEAGEAINGLWYGQGDDRLHRENLRRILDGLPMLFCHQYFFLLPVCLGDVANALGQFEESLEWYRLVYDERRLSKQRGIYLYLNDQIEGEMMRVRIAQNFVEWADFLFNQNTEESRNEALFRYRQALHTLETELCCEQERKLYVSMKDLSQNLSKSALPASAANQIYHTVAELTDRPGKHVEVLSLIDDIQQIVAGDEESETIGDQLTSLLAERVSSVRPQPPLSSIAEKEKTLPERLADMERKHPDVLDDIEDNIRLNKALPKEPPARASLSSQPSSRAFLPLPAERQPTESLTAESALTPLTDFAVVSTFSVPYETYKDTSFHEMYNKIGPLIGLPENLIPELPDWLLPTEPPVEYVIYKVLPLWVWYGHCVPKNPVLDALTKRACLGIFHIDYCFNSLGFPQNDLSVYRFEYLVSMAKNFAQMALAAEKDFIQFKEQFEKDTFELMNASQAVAIAQVGVRLAQLRVQEALDQKATAVLGIEKVNAQIALTRKRIDELGSDWSIFGVVFGAIISVVGTIATAGAGAPAYMTVGGLFAGIGSTGAGAANYMAGKEENEENLRMQLQLLETVEYNAAQQNRTNAINAERSTRWQARIAELESKFAAEKAKFLSTEFFNPQLWSFLAREVKKNYRTYLTYGAIAAWLSQRALEFQRGVEPRRRFAASGPDESGSGLNIIRFDYFQPSIQGLLGADNLLRDIASLENEKFLNEQRKKQITKVISLASTRPFVFAQFLETGVLPFTITLEEFDQDYSGHYQRRIRNVRVNLFGLVGQEGIKATLTCLGASQVVVREFIEENSRIKPKFVEKTLRRPPESVALTSPQGGGIGQIPLVPKEDRLNPFEGQGVAAQWVFEMHKYANKINYNTITDIQILIDYTALDDTIYRQEVINRLPTTQTGMRPYSFCAEFFDACFHLKDGTRSIGMIETNDGTTGAHTLVLHTRESDFSPNQKNRRLKEIVVYFRSKDEDSPGYSKLRLYLICKQKLDTQQISQSDLTFKSANQPGEFKKADTPKPSEYKPAPHYLGKWQAKDLNIQGDVSVAGTWYLHIPPKLNKNFIKKENGQDVVVNGHKVFDFSDLQDVIFALHYEYDLDKPSA
jgi:hypothetical protein